MPGQSLGEVESAEAFGVSRTIVRDAFKRLETEGLIEIKSHIGTYVSLIDLNQISEAIFIREYIEKAIISELTINNKLAFNMQINYVLKAQKLLLENNDIKEGELARKFIEIDNLFHKTLFEVA